MGEAADDARGGAELLGDGHSAASRNSLAIRRRGLEDIQYEIRQRGFDNPHSHFSESRLVHDWLNEFLRGGVSTAAYWDRWRQAQSWTAPRYGGPGGGWGRLAAPGNGARLSRPRPGRDAGTLTSAA